MNCGESGAFVCYLQYPPVMCRCVLVHSMVCPSQQTAKHGTGRLGMAWGVLNCCDFGGNPLFVAWRPWALGTQPCFHVACVLLSRAEKTVVTTFDVLLNEGMVHSLLSLLSWLSEFVIMIWEHVPSV